MFSFRGCVWVVQSAFIFELTTFGRTFRLGAPSESERAAWIAELIRRIDQRTGVKTKVGARAGAHSKAGGFEPIGAGRWRGILARGERRRHNARAGAHAQDRQPRRERPGAGRLPGQEGRQSQGGVSCFLSASPGPLPMLTRRFARHCRPPELEAALLPSAQGLPPLLQGRACASSASMAGLGQAAC